MKLDDRLTRAIRSSISMSVFKVVQILVTIFTLPLVLSALGTSDFGIYIAIQAFATWFLFDNGLTESIKKVIIDGKHQADWTSINKTVTTGLIILSLFSSLIFFVLYFFEEFFSFGEWLFGNKDVNYISLWLIVLIIIPLRLIRDILTGLERGYVFSNFNLFTPLIQLVLTLYGVYSDRGVSYYVLTLFIPQLSSLILCWCYLIINPKSRLKISFKYFDLKSICDIKKDAVHFFMLGFSLMIINTADPFVINLISGPEITAEFSFIYRIGVYATIMMSFIVYPMWPAIGSAISTGDLEWAKEKTKKLILISTVFGGLISLLLAFLGQNIVSVWSKGLINVSGLSVILISLFTFFKIVTTTMSTILKAYGEVEGQAKITFFEAILHIILLVPFSYYFGLDGACFSILISIIFTRGIYMPMKIREIVIR
ncbi:TPA: lipopolysaccharide biosynthesis protein [Vibrio harveyi]|uniref:lipopolysaccharide biosynthesis protein n=1 Tax=Vibrio harveyi TaxID=669 RepID=UPI0039095C7C